MVENESFNPELKNVPYRGSAQGSERTENNRRQTVKKKTTSFEFFTSQTSRLCIGTAILFIAVFFSVAFVSYFSTGMADQSKVNNNTYSEQLNIEMTAAGQNADSNGIVVAENGDDALVKNWGKVFGAWVSESLINKGVGIGAFLIILWLSVLAVRIYRGKELHFFRFTFLVLFSLLSFCVIFGGLKYNFESGASFDLGGNLGWWINDFLKSTLGFAVYLVKLFVGIVWVAVFYRSLKEVYDFAKGKVDSVKHIRSSKSAVDSRTEEAPLSDFRGDNGREEVEDIKFESSKYENTFIPTPKEDERKQVEEKPISQTVEEPAKIEKKDAPIAPQPIVREVVKEEQLKQEEQPKEEELIINESEEIEVVEPNSNVYDPTKELSKFKTPSVDLLKDYGTSKVSVDVQEQGENKALITKTLLNYGIEIKKIEVTVGPTITLFEIVPRDGIRIQKIKVLEDDIAMSLAAKGIRIIAPLPGKGTVGIEVPNREPQIVSMRSMMCSKAFQETSAALPMALGCTVTNEVVVADMAKMPHLLVAGATGQGKSVGLNTIITSLLFKKHPAELKFVLVDPKCVEFSLYSAIERHYLAKLPDEEKAIITQIDKVVPTLNSLVVEMEDRYRLLEMAQERNIKDYNNKFINHQLNPNNGHRYLPYIVLIIDEFGDLIIQSGKEVETPLVRLAQKARAIGIHMILATQRPDVKTITGAIKANFPSRIAFRVSQMQDSRTIIDSSGAQHLIGKGDMLFSADGEITRVQCAFIDTPEVSRVCNFIHDQIGYSEAYSLPEPPMNEDEGSSSGGMRSGFERDSLFEDALHFIALSDTASTSSLQRHFGIGYNRAGKIMDQMEAAGIVGPSVGGKPRKVLMSPSEIDMFLGK